MEGRVRRNCCFGCYLGNGHGREQEIRRDSVFMKKSSDKIRSIPVEIRIRKGGKILFWTLLTYVAVGQTVGFVTPKENVVAKQSISKVEERENPATSEGAKVFSKGFAQQYYSWNKSSGGVQDRQNRLAPYLQKGVDEQAGLNINSTDVESKVSGDEVVEVTPTSDNTANITVKVQVKTIKNEEGKPPAEDNKTQFLVVPVISNGKGYKVTDIPYQTIYNNKFTKEKATSPLPGKEVDDPRIQEDVTTFLATFFQVYLSDNPTQLAYYTTDKDLQVLDKVLAFKEIDNLKLYQSKGSYTVVAQVKFQDTHTKATVTYPYTLQIEKQQDKWLVKKLQNQS